MGEWNENDHPRNQDGTWGDKNGRAPSGTDDLPADPPFNPNADMSVGIGRREIWTGYGTWDKRVSALFDEIGLDGPLTVERNCDPTRGYCVSVEYPDKRAGTNRQLLFVGDFQGSIYSVTPSLTGTRIAMLHRSAKDIGADLAASGLYEHTMSKEASRRLAFRDECERNGFIETHGAWTRRLLPVVQSAIADGRTPNDDDLADIATIMPVRHGQFVNAFTVAPVYDMIHPDHSRDEKFEALFGGEYLSDRNLRDVDDYIMKHRGGPEFNGSREIRNAVSLLGHVADMTHDSRTKGIALTAQGNLLSLRIGGKIRDSAQEKLRARVARLRARGRAFEEAVDH